MLFVLAHELAHMLVNGNLRDSVGHIVNGNILEQVYARKKTLPKRKRSLHALFSEVTHLRSPANHIGDGGQYLLTRNRRVKIK